MENFLRSNSQPVQALTRSEMIDLKAFDIEWEEENIV